LVAELREALRLPVGRRFNDAPLDSDFSDLAHEALSNVSTVFRERAPLLRAVVNAETVASEAHQEWVDIRDDFINDLAARIRWFNEAGLSTVTNSEMTARALVMMTESVLLGTVITDATTAALAEVMYRAIFASGGERV